MYNLSDNKIISNVIEFALKNGMSEIMVDIWNDPLPCSASVAGSDVFLAEYQDVNLLPYLILHEMGHISKDDYIPYSEFDNKWHLYSIYEELRAWNYMVKHISKFVPFDSNMIENAIVPNMLSYLVSRSGEPCALFLSDVIVDDKKVLSNLPFIAEFIQKISFPSDMFKSNISRDYMYPENCSDDTRILLTYEQYIGVIRYQYNSKLTPIQIYIG